MHSHFSQSSRAVNKSSRGPLVQANSDNGVAIFTGYDLNPGESRSATVRIGNVDSVTARLRLGESEATNDLGAELILTIEDVSAARVLIYAGTVGELPAGAIDLGTFEPGEERTYRFTVYLDMGAPLAGNRGAGAFYEWELEAESSS